MEKRKITEILEEMDRVEKVEISNDLVDTLRDYFKKDIEEEDAEEDKVAKSPDANQVDVNKENIDHGQSDRI